MRGDGGGAVWSWLIGVIALSLLVWAVVELVAPRGMATVRVLRAPAAPELGLLGVGEEAVELHWLLPDATDDLGRVVRIDGTVVGESSAAGFWVRDFRDNIVFVARDESLGAGAGPPALVAGDAVRVHGVVAILSPAEQAERLGRAGLVVPASAIVVQDVKVLSMEGGIEVLRQ